MVQIAKRIPVRVRFQKMYLKKETDFGTALFLSVWVIKLSKIMGATRKQLNLD